MFKVYKEPCKNCLLSKDAIVSPKRRREIISGCVKQQSFFVCHKATIEGENTCCHTFFKEMGHVSQMVRIAQRLNMVEMVDQPESERLKSHRELSKL